MSRRARTRQGPALGVAAALAIGFATFAAAGGASTPQATPPSNTSRPAISGTPRVGETLTASPGTWRGDRPITFTYQWVRCNSSLGNCGPRAGATSRRYALTSSDQGRRLIVVVNARNAAGTGSAQSGATFTIGARATSPVNSSPPAISGTPQEGQALTASSGGWRGTQPITFAYQWVRCDRNGGSCADIGGATGQSYTLTSADVGQTLRVRVTARNAAGSRSATSVPSAVVTRAAPPGPDGQIRLPNGKISIPVTSVSLPVRLIVDQSGFAPNPVRSRSSAITARFRVSDTRGFVVRGALVFLRSTPLLTTPAPEQGTQVDGTVTFRFFPRSDFPLRNGYNVQFFVRARKAGENPLAGVSTRRLVQVRTASPR
jgi:hypothetical protein